jgi:muconolactone delta-isomerase
MAPQPQTPNTESQRSAMKKLSFLVGKWSGEARMFRAPSGPVEMAQTEKVEYKLDGLILTIEGAGRNKSDGKPTLQAFGIVSYDDEAGTYRMRAFNDGRWLETEMKLAESGKELTWGFTLGEIKTHSVLHIDDKGEWTELHEITISAQPPRKFMEVRVSLEN